MKKLKASWLYIAAIIYFFLFSALQFLIFPGGIFEHKVAALLLMLPIFLLIAAGLYLDYNATGRRGYLIGIIAVFVWYIAGILAWLLLLERYVHI